MLFVAFGFVAGSLALAGIPVDPWYLALAVSGVLITYQMDRAFGGSPEDRINHPDRLDWWNNHRLFAIGSTAAAGVLALYSIIRLDPRFLVPVVVLGLVGGLYAMPVLPGRVRPKAVPFLKMLLIAGCWMFGGIILPAYLVQDHWSGPFLIVALYRLPILSTDLLVTDYQDRRGDRSAGVVTLGMSGNEDNIRKWGMILSLSGLFLAGILFFVVSPSGRGMLAVDAIGYLLAVRMFRSHSSLNDRFLLKLDLLVGWPLVTFIWSLFQ